jgi:uncharacterized protein
VYRIKQVGELGGKIKHPPTDIDSSMRFALIQDPPGALLSIISTRRQISSSLL